MLRPILIEDYKYEESPESLQHLMTFFESSHKSQSKVDILVGIIFLLMVECGFVPSNYTSCEPSFDFHYKRMMQLSKNLPVEGPRGSDHYCFKMVLPNLEQFEVKLVIVCVSDDLIVNCFVKGMRGHFNVLLDPLTYFTSSNVNLKEVKFQHLDHLSRLIKNNVAFPAKSYILKQNGIALPCLEDLPPEVVFIIMKQLPLVDLGQFGKTNTKFSDLFQDLFNKFGKKMQ